MVPIDFGGDYNFRPSDYEEFDLSPLDGPAGPTNNEMAFFDEIMSFWPVKGENEFSDSLFSGVGFVRRNRLVKLNADKTIPRGWGDEPVFEDDPDIAGDFH